MKESKTTYAYLITNMKEPSFNKVRNIACDFISKIPLELVDELHDSLNRGVDMIDLEPLMQMYFYAYGNMHFAKLEYAFSHINSYVATEEYIDIIDYGCGQGLATMCYHDYIINHSIQQKVRSIVLIEPSLPTLERAELLCSHFFPEASITPINKAFDDLLESDISIQGDIPTLHLFSNILDVESFNINNLAQKVKTSCRGDNEFIIVSPIQNDKRIERLKLFAKLLEINLYFEKKFSKSKFREDKNWTCFAILGSTRANQLANLNLKEVYRKSDQILNDVFLRQDKVLLQNVFNDLKIGAENGDTKCMNFIGRFYCVGIHVDKDIKKALEWLNLAAEKGNWVAIHNITMLYARGQGIKQNLDKAKKLIDELEKNDKSLYYHASGVLSQMEANHDLATVFFKKGAELGHSDSEYNYSKYLLNGSHSKKDFKLAIKYLKSAGKKNHSGANLILAKFYETGFEKGGINKSNSQAIKYLRLSAIKGKTEAQLKLVEIYERGLLGASKNSGKAFTWRLVLAESGNTDVLFDLAYCYYKGIGTKQDTKEALKWYRLAAENGSIAAINNLALCYQRGIGIEKNEEYALSLYLEAAQKGSLVAANNLSVCYLKGIGTSIKLEEALFWKEKAAICGDKQAQNTLAKWYFKGLGKARDLSKALFWFIKGISDSKINSEIKTLDDALFHLKKEAEANNVIFQYILAKCYEYGISTPKNFEQAKYWHKKAADLGFIESSIKLHRITSLSTKVTSEELSKSVTDEYGVVYTHDWKKVLSCKFVNCNYYKIRKGTRIIADEAFAHQNIKTVVIPASVVLIGDNPFIFDPYYNKKIKVDNKSSCYKIIGSALFTKDASKIISYWGDDTHFLVPDGVQIIGANCFTNAIKLNKITFCDGIKFIGNSAFRNCYALESIDLPSSLNYLGNSCFRGCENLETIWALGSVNIIKPRTFEGCNLKFIHLPSNLIKIEEDAFNSNKELKNIDLPDSVVELGNSAFAFCKSLKYINLGTKICKIGDFCFYECSFDKVILPSSLKSLGIKSFSNVKEFEIKKDSIFMFKSGMIVRKENSCLECYCGNNSSLELTGIKDISPLAFFGSDVETISMSNSMSIVPKYSFYGARKLKKITLPLNLKLIETGACAYCENLKEITIPSKTKVLQEGVFYECTSLETIKFKNINTTVSESIIYTIRFNSLPSIYNPDYVLTGSTVDEILFNRNIELLKIIYVIIPIGSQDNYNFKPVFSSHGMERTFIILEDNENS